MLIYAEDQMTGNWRQIPDCVIISPSTTACSSARGGRTERCWEEKGKNQMSEDLPSTNKAPQTTVFSSGSHGECQAINSTSPGFF